MHGKGARFFVPMKTAQDIAGADQRVSMFYVRSKGDTEGVRNELVKLLPTYKIRSMAEYSTLMTSSNLPELKPFIRSFVTLGVVISFLVVLLTMHTMVLERTRDIGVLKALGSSRLEICWMIVGETLVMVALGVAFGLLCTYSVVAILHRTSPTLQIAIEGGWIVRAILLTIAGAIAGRFIRPCEPPKAIRWMLWPTSDSLNRIRASMLPCLVTLFLACEESRLHGSETNLIQEGPGWPSSSSKHANSSLHGARMLRVCGGEEFSDFARHIF